MTLLEPAGRRTPYTDAGLRRMACWRCGQRAAFQWRYRSCAHAQAGGLSFFHYRPLCVPCDIECNRMALEFFDEPGRDEIIAAYVLEAWQFVHDETGGAYCADVAGCPHH